MTTATATLDMLPKVHTVAGCTVTVSQETDEDGTFFMVETIGDCEYTGIEVCGDIYGALSLGSEIAEYIAEDAIRAREIEEENRMEEAQIESGEDW
jgi:hypothetical protein